MKVPSSLETSHKTMAICPVYNTSRECSTKELRPSAQRQKQTHGCSGAGMNDSSKNTDVASVAFSKGST